MQLDQPAQQDQMEQLVLVGLQVLLALVAQLVHKAAKVQRELQVIKVAVASKVQQGQKVRPVQKDS